jgi:hypothetical protein
MAKSDSQFLAQSALDGFDHDALIEANVELEFPTPKISGPTAVITHLLARANEYQLNLRPTQWTSTSEVNVEMFLLFISLLMDSTVSALVALTGSGVLLPTIIIQRSIVEYFVRAAYFDVNPNEMNQAFDHFAFTQYTDMKRDPKVDPSTLDVARKFYEDTKRRNPLIEKRDTPLREMMQVITSDPHGWMYNMFIGVPSEVVHGLAGGVYRTLSTQDGATTAIIQRSSDELAWDMLTTARCLIQFGDVLARRFQGKATVDRAWLEGRLLALERKFEMV